MIDASLGEIMTTCEKITWLLGEGESWLKPEYRYSSILLTFNGYFILRFRVCGYLYVSVSLTLSSKIVFGLFIF